VSKFRRRFYTCKNFDYNQAPFNTIARSHAAGTAQITAADGRGAQGSGCRPRRASGVPGRVKDDPGGKYRLDLPVYRTCVLLDR